MPDASVEVVGLPADAPRIRALFYREEDGGYSLRFRVYDKPFAITEAFITGNGQSHSIVRLTKVNRELEGRSGTAFPGGTAR